ncbi:MAG: hypothetical protein ACRDF5_05305 [bacterium]
MLASVSTGHRPPKALRRAGVGLAVLLVLAPGTVSFGQTPLRLIEFGLPTPNVRPHSSAAAPDGRVYFAELAANKLGVFDPRTERFTEYPVPLPASQPHGVCVDPKTGLVYFTLINGNQIAQLNPVSGQVRLFDVPTPNSGPHTPWPDREGNIYFTEARAGKIGRLEPATGSANTR